MPSCVCRRIGLPVTRSRMRSRSELLAGNSSARKKHPCWYRRAYTARNAEECQDTCDQTTSAAIQPLQVELACQIGMALGQVVAATLRSIDPARRMENRSRPELRAACSARPADGDSALFAKCRHHVADLAYKRATGRPTFVKQQKLRLRHQRAADRQHLLLPARHGR